MMKTEKTNWCLVKAACTCMFRAVNRLFAHQRQVASWEELEAEITRILENKDLDEVVYFDRIKEEIRVLSERSEDFFLSDKGFGLAVFVEGEVPLSSKRTYLREVSERLRIIAEHRTQELNVQTRDVSNKGKTSKTEIPNGWSRVKEQEILHWQREIDAMEERIRRRRSGEEL
jgi:hypothetical protein